MINHSAMETFVSERQGGMLAEADGRRLAARRGVSARRTFRPADALRRRAVFARTPSETLAPSGAGGLRALLRLSRA
jgi:hypothetical protein